MSEERKAFIIMCERDWADTPSDRKNTIIFLTLRDFHDRLVSLRHLNNLYSFLGGLIGGMIAIMSYHFLLKL